MTAGTTGLPPQLSRLLAEFDDRRPAALARTVSLVENRRDGFELILSTLYSRVGRARRIGITGPPGAGKSTITTRLAALAREGGQSVGIVAVDPTSPFTGGALLGDRIRMESVALDPGIFIRSMATRGSLGGLAAATREVADVLDAFGFDRVIVETVGVGQSELDIARVADTSVVVLVPESGDAIQTMKAGLMEIADIFVINKADRPGADRLKHEVELMLGYRLGQGYRDIPAHHGVDLRRPKGAATDGVHSEREPDRWTPPVLTTVAERGEGIDALASALGRHADYLVRTGELQRRRRARVRDRVVDVVERLVQRRLWSDAGTQAWLDEQIPALEAGHLTPYAAASALLERSAAQLAKG